MERRGYLASAIRRTTESIVAVEGFVVLTRYLSKVHCQDLIKATYRNRTGIAPFDLAFDLFTEALDAWLPCFETDSGHGQRPLIVQ